MNIQDILKQIATLRETKNKEQEAYKLIEDTKKEVEAVQQWDILAKLYWEESLVAQHEAMNQFSKEETTQDKNSISQAINHMETAALKASEIINEHKLDKMLGTSYRFLGNVYRYKKDFKKAQEAFENAMTEYQRNDDKGTLEIRGFLAYCLIQNGEIQNGIKLGLETFDAFENSEKGKKLKEKDYFTWAVWRSGIVPRLVEALVETKTEFDKEEILNYLNESEKILKEPQGEITWGDTAFQLRIGEINKAKEIIK